MRSSLYILASFSVLVSGCATHSVHATAPSVIQADPNAAVYAFAMRAAEDVGMTEETLVDSDQKKYEIDLAYPSYVGESGLKYYFIVMDPAKAYAVLGSGSRTSLYRYSAEDVARHQINVVPGSIAVAPAVQVNRLSARRVRDEGDPLGDVEFRADLNKLFPGRELVKPYKPVDQ
jgi:hypothetical protein